MRILKRDGVEAEFDRKKIERAIEKANKSVTANERLSEDVIKDIALKIEQDCSAAGTIPTVESVQDKVIYAIMSAGAYVLANNYIIYRYTHALQRQKNTTDDKISAILQLKSQAAMEENSNKNPTIVSTQRDYMAGEVSRDLTRRKLLPEDIIHAHDEGRIHFHDSDYFAQASHNCDLVNLEDMLQNGTCISGTLIERPHSFSTACNIATQIIAQVASSQYGGQTITLTHLAPFVNESRVRFRQHVIEELSEVGIEYTEEQVDKITERRVLRDVEKGVQIIQYQVITLMTTNGQAPFISVAMYLNEAGNDQLLRDDLALIIKEMLHQRYVGVKNEKGVYITPAFPKLLYFLEPDNAYPGTKYWDVTEEAIRCSLHRMVPDYISEKVMLLNKIDANGEGHAYPCMGCRSFLTPYIDPNTGKGKYYGRFNQGVVTVNLPFVAMSSQRDLDTFWREFDETLELCHRALRLRHERLLGTPSDVAPILWQYGALARLEKGEPIDKLLYGGYSTLSLGYAGLYEAVYYLTGHSHTDLEGEPLALAIMQHMNDKCAEWKAAENIDYSLYGTPLESTTYKFAKALKQNFGIVENVSDHGYVTNSYHVCVREEINAFDKLKFESKFQKLSPGGAISYVEIPNMEDNIEAAEAIVEYIYENIMYAELNSKSDYCQCCGYSGEIKIVEDDGKLVWECPNCGNRDQHKMNVARRTCGYIGTQFWNRATCSVTRLSEKTAA
ncbi:anaerobic ribonucleoside-triphosphate reductase [Butyricicoccus faecihominis]|nr:anaerobic ribonucleoside-triphosphate reductase [Butyricicoccus sp. AF22-28AC]MBT9816207.1 anaerobic ribonucleoside-triphosphate reductase [Butyricicoccus faecihominis]RHQ84302.1 anaerobic ribonucleoside-triphosphate reductase [Butyricicoccus sp. AF22-28AC]